jgi:hypothetical protein
MRMSNGVEPRSRDERPLVFKSIPFVLVHLGSIGLWWTGFHLREAVVCFMLYHARMFFITAGFHRYFAHRAYKMGRVMQFAMAWGGSSACQKGVLWWAAHHRSHHRYSDTERDIHSPKRGFWWSHVGWILCPKHQATDWASIKDFSKYPELVWLNRYHLVPGITLGVTCYHLLPAWWMGGVVDVLPIHDAAVSWHLLHQFVVALVGPSSLRHDGHEQELLPARAHHHGRGLAQQPPLLPVDGQPGLLLVGGGSELLPPAMEKLRLVSDLRTPPPHVLVRNRVDGPTASHGPVVDSVD